MLRHNLDILHLLENEIAKYSELGSLLIIGDTKARTGIERDLIDNDDKHILYRLIHKKSRFTKERNSQYLHVCSRIKELLELCIQANLSILNGKTFSDRFCKYTCISLQYNDKGFVDFCIASIGLIEYDLFFHVHDHIPH